MAERRLPNYCTGYNRKDLTEKAFCPKCGEKLPDGVPGAISRYDNSTELCPDCGVEESDPAAHVFTK